MSTCPHAVESSEVSSCFSSPRPHFTWMHWSKYTAVSYLQNIWQSNVANRFVWNIATFESNLQQIKVSSDWLNKKVPQSFCLWRRSNCYLGNNVQLSIWILIFLAKSPLNNQSIAITKFTFVASVSLSSIFPRLKRSFPASAPYLVYLPRTTMSRYKYEGNLRNTPIPRNKANIAGHWPGQWERFLGNCRNSTTDKKTVVHADQQSVISEHEIKAQHQELKVTKYLKW